MTQSLHCLSACALACLLGAAQLGFGLVSNSAHAESTDLTDLGIDQLMGMEVTTASKKEQKLAETAAAVFVLSHDDIQRSGATTLPELLLMVPGVDGGAINSHSAVIGIRGLGGQWSNKLLVLIDGRSVYTQTFAGVYWDTHNIIFEDIERIEVIRGPNAAMWGANAVNGVINIITKSSGTTQGTLLRATAGTGGNRDIAARQGIKLSENGYARVYANGETHGDSKLHQGGNGEDHWDSQRVGFRADWDFRSGDRFLLEGEAYDIDTHSGLAATSSPLAAQTAVLLDAALNNSASTNGHSLLANWTRAYALTSEWSTQLYWSRSDRNEFIPVVEDNVDFEFQHRFQPGRNQDLVWGFEARYHRDASEQIKFLRFDPYDTDEVHPSLFFQDDFAFADNKYHIVLGSRFERDPYNGWELQPSLRALWNASEDRKVWIAVSRSARTPARIDRDIAAAIPATFDVPGVGTVPATVRLQGDKVFASETALSYELGYRARLAADFSIDIALFHSHYENLRSVGDFDVDFTPTGVVLTVPMNNGMKAVVDGGEIVANWVPRTDWRLQLFWSELHLDVDDESTQLNLGANYQGSSPERQLGLRSDWDFAPRWSADVQLKYVGELSNPFNAPMVKNGEVPAYVDADLRLAWQATPGVELALLGKNLFDRSRLEFSSESGSALTEAKRAAYLRATWSF